MGNEQILSQLWDTAGQSIDEQRLRIFRIMTASQQREILESIKRDSMNQTNITQGLQDDQSK